MPDPNLQTGSDQNVPARASWHWFVTSGLKPWHECYLAVCASCPGGSRAANVQDTEDALLLLAQYGGGIFPLPTVPIPPPHRLPGVYCLKKKQDKLIIKITSGKFWNKTLICLALSSPRPWFAATPVPWFSALFGAFSATFYLLDPDPYGGFGSRKSPIIQTRSVLDLHSRITTFESWIRIF